MRPCPNRRPPLRFRKGVSSEKLSTKLALYKMQVKHQCHKKADPAVSKKCSTYRPEWPSEWGNDSQPTPAKHVMGQRIPSPLWSPLAHRACPAAGFFFRPGGGRVRRGLTQGGSGCPPPPWGYPSTPLGPIKSREFNFFEPLFRWKSLNPFSRVGEGSDTPRLRVHRP